MLLDVLDHWFQWNYLLQPNGNVRWHRWLHHKAKKYRHDVYSSIRHRLGFPESTLQVLKSYPPSSDVGDHPKTLSDMILDPRKIIRQSYLDHTGCRIVHNCDKLRQTRLGFPESTPQVLKSYPPILWCWRPPQDIEWHDFRPQENHKAKLFGSYRM